MTDPLEAIRQLYFKATAKTIETDFDDAIDLLKSLPDETQRERATVYMEGLAEMRRQWTGTKKHSQPPSDPRQSASASAKAKVRGTKQPTRDTGGRTARRKDGT